MITFIFWLLYVESSFISLAYFAVANLARFEMPICCLVSVRYQYLIWYLSSSWITGVHAIYPPTERLLPPTGIERLPF